MPSPPKNAAPRSTFDNQGAGIPPAAPDVETAAPDSEDESRASRVRRIAGRLGKPALAILVALLVAALLMQASGYHAATAFAQLFTGATGLERGPAANPTHLALDPLPFHLNKFLLAGTLARATPLIFTGLAIALALRAGLFNIGAQGQMVLGALAAALVGRWGLTNGSVSGPQAGSLSPWLHLPLVLLAGVLMGALWGVLPGLLKAYRGVHEVIATIMLNYIGLNAASYLATHSLKDASSMAKQTPLMAQSAWLAPLPLFEHTNLTLGLLLALLIALLYAFFITRTALGFQIRAVGQGAEAAHAAGISVPRTLITTMALSGGLAGLAGAVEVCGIHHRYVEGVAGNYGYDAIAVALLGSLGGPGVILAALFFGALASGASYMQSQTDVPESIAVIVQALVIVGVGIRVLPHWKRKPIV